MFISVIGWIILGLAAGYIASKFVNKHGERLQFDIVLGILGAVIGGWLSSAGGTTGATGLNAWSLMVAVVGAVVFLAVGHTIRNLTSHA